MTSADYILLVRRLRHYQRKWLASRSQEDLESVRKTEKEVDNAKIEDSIFENLTEAGERLTQAVERLTERLDRPEPRKKPVDMRRVMHCGVPIKASLMRRGIA